MHCLPLGLFTALLLITACSDQRSPDYKALESDEAQQAAQGPSRIRIKPDNHRAEWVGRTADGKQFFVTNLFVARDSFLGIKGCEYVAVILWDKDGSFLELRLDTLGPRADLNGAQVMGVIEERIKELGDIKLQEIVVAPFQEVREGVEFGLIHFRDSDSFEWVELMPGNSMAFTPPWDGRYDT